MKLPPKRLLSWPIISTAASGKAAATIDIVAS
jgi:hypothetical protein